MKVAADAASAVYLYDTTLNVTWLRDANANGAVNWWAATSWAADLETGIGSNTISDWRVPTWTGESEMSILYFNTLGHGYMEGLTNTGSFQNMQSYWYWLGPEFEHPEFASAFSTVGGYQKGGNRHGQLYAMAVRSGDVMAAVPEPETYMMLLLGLGAVGALSRRRARCEFS